MLRGLCVLGLVVSTGLLSFSAFAQVPAGDASAASWVLSPAVQSWAMALGAPGALMLGAFALGRLAETVGTRLAGGLVIRHEHALSPDTRLLLEEVLVRDGRGLSPDVRAFLERVLSPEAREALEELAQRPSRGGGRTAERRTG